jgi:putative acetyltransferase
MQLRTATLEDIPALAVLYRESARVLGASAYSPAQVEAWASWPDDFAGFQQRLGSGITLVSLVGGCIASFGQLDPVDHVALLYTNPLFARRGHASAVLSRLEKIAGARGVKRLDTTASHLSRPLFEKFNFALCEVEHAVFKGVGFERFKMEKILRVSA